MRLALCNRRQGLSNNFNLKKEKNITNKEKESSSTPQTLHPSLMTVMEKVDEAWGRGYTTVGLILKMHPTKIDD